ncbi:precorrin-3B C(17)-methyltransferase [Vulcanibacillus modesticaldus]|uniref:Precorrin-3B C(17)-methyltransferase n=1 Tax=Vulcanibacillus modesticaldus TaxID=337097 RepID=A0A1D2YUD9_9BACI|nr:RsfA family transcriptional regulator [Vulcanibacillus modesticaldus]OEF99283.1 precorrin-3B C(17)-methyltransferase [Vulcanibacillus modesticaldus]
MVANRQDAWSEDDDLLLAEVTLRHIREGSTQLAAFEEVGRKLNRTAAACGFRWNSLVRKKYEAAIQIAKAQRQKRGYQKTSNNIFSETTNNITNEFSNELVTDLVDSELESITFDTIIRFLKKQKSLNKNFKKYEKEIEEKNKEIQQLREENKELRNKIKYLESDYKVVNEDYKALIQIIDRARKLAFLNEDEVDSKPIFKMDPNGNLERINK